ncbi:hypothetical protein Tco_1491178 [Tanacetum coccineum]
MSSPDHPTANLEDVFSSNFPNYVPPVKTIDEEVQLHALVDGKKLIITESTVRRDLKLEVSEVLDVSKVCTSVLEKQLEGMETHTRIYIAPSHTKKIFGNMRRVGKGFSRRVTPLFPTMVVQNQSEMAKGLAMPTDPHHTPIILQPLSQPQKKHRPRNPKRKDTQVPQSSVPTENVADEAIYKDLDDSLVRAATTASSLEAKQDSDDAKMFDADVLYGEEMFVIDKEVAAKDVNLTVDAVTLAQAPAYLKSVKPKEKGDVIEEPSVPVSVVSASTKVSAATIRTATIPTPRKGIVITKLGTPTITRSSQQPSQAKVHDKGKGKMVEPERPMKKKD